MGDTGEQVARARGAGAEATALRRLVLAAVPLSTGGAVLVSIVTSSGSLLAPALLLLVATGLTGVAIARGLGPDARLALHRRLQVGLWAGVPATAAYDLVRYLVVSLAGWSVRPFAVFALFGQMLIGDGQPLWARYLAGTAFHLLNGLGFAVGYALVFRRPGAGTAVAWALVLEALTVVFYPSWLGVTALGEFVSMSMIGHLAYGVVLGPATRKRLAMVGPGAPEANP